MVEHSYKAKHLGLIGKKAGSKTKADHCQSLMSRHTPALRLQQTITDKHAYKHIQTHIAMGTCTMQCAMRRVGPRELTMQSASRVSQVPKVPKCPGVLLGLVSICLFLRCICQHCLEKALNFATVFLPFEVTLLVPANRLRVNFLTLMTSNKKEQQDAGVPKDLHGIYAESMWLTQVLLLPCVQPPKCTGCVSVSPLALYNTAR